MLKGLVHYLSDQRHICPVAHQLMKVNIFPRPSGGIIYQRIHLTQKLFQYLEVIVIHALAGSAPTHSFHCFQQIEYFRNRASFDLSDGGSDVWLKGDETIHL